MDTLLDKDLHRIRRGRHVGTLADAAHTMGDQRPGIRFGQLILGGTGEGGFSGIAPYGMTILGVSLNWRKLGLRMLLQILDQRSSACFLDLFQRFQIDAVAVIQRAGRVRAGNGPSPQLVELFDGIDRHIARP